MFVLLIYGGISFLQDGPLTLRHVPGAPWENTCGKIDELGWYRLVYFWDNTPDMTSQDKEAISVERILIGTDTGH